VGRASGEAGTEVIFRKNAVQIMTEVNNYSNINDSGIYPK
jgi:hypothetical protein